MAKVVKSAPPENFESALTELEKLVSSMESGELSLEGSLAAHKRGIELVQYCQSALTRAQQQGRMLEDGALKNIPGGGQPAK